MKKRAIFLILCLLTTIIAGACTPAVQTAEVTRLIRQTVVVTQKETLIITPTNSPATSASFPNTPTKQPTQDLNYTVGGEEITIIQYYTLLGYHLYEDSYQLLSTRAHQEQNLNDYLEGVKQAYNVVNILEVKPFPYVTPPGTTPIPGLEHAFRVKIYATGIGAMSGSQPNGIQQFHIVVVQENGDWKIDQINTA